MAKDQTTAPARKTAAKKATPAKKAPAPRKAPARKATAAKAPPAGPPAGWYPDPDDAQLRRYWDGRDWLGVGVPEHLIPADAAGAPANDPHGRLAALLDGEPDPAPAAKANQVTGQITYRGRRLNVVMPTAEQLAIWQRTALKLQAAGAAGGMTGAEAMKLLQRILTLMGSVLVDEVDRDWIEDAILGGDLDLMGAAAIVSLALTELSRQAETLGAKAAPRNGPAPKARRKR
jgi:hypothetical protein